MMGVWGLWTLRRPWNPPLPAGGIWGRGPLMKGQMGLLREVRRSLWLSKRVVPAMPARVF